MGALCQAVDLGRYAAGWAAPYTNVPKLLDVCLNRGNGRPARFLSDCTGEPESQLAGTEIARG
jgi:hypothetical protein